MSSRSSYVPLLACAVLAACGPDTVLTTGGSITELVAAGDRLFWVEENGDGTARSLRSVLASGGEPVDIRPGKDGACDVVGTDAERVYWVEPIVLYSAPVGGGAPTLVRELTGLLADAVWLDGDFVYWWWSENGAASKVVRAPKAGGGEPSVVVNFQSVGEATPVGPKAMAIAGSRFLWLSDSSVDGVASAALWSVPLDGSAAATKVGETSVYTENGDAQLQADATHAFVFVAGVTGSMPVCVALADGKVTTLMGASDRIQSLRVFGPDIYLMTRADKWEPAESTTAPWTLVRVSREGGDVETLATGKNADSLTAVTALAESVFWAAGSELLKLAR